MKGIYSPLVSAVAGLALMSAPAINSAEATPPAKEVEKESRADLEAKVKRLEKRVEQLEQLLKESNQRAENNWGEWRQRRGFDRDMNEIFDRLQREMQRDLGFEVPLGPQNFRGGFPGNKPRLGVELALPTDDLKERFKNDVKDGAFVMSVVPGSVAEKTGLSVGDAITSFDGKPVSNPQDLIDAVRNAPPGKHDIEIARRGESLKLKADLGEQAVETEFDEPKIEGGWLRRGDMERRGGAMRSKTEVKASAFEVTDALVKELKLSDEQRKKMAEVLNKHAAAVNEEAAARTTARQPRRGGGIALGMNSDISRMVDKHAVEAEKELAGTLSPDQIAKWSDYRKTHNSVSVSQSTVIDGTGGAGGGVPADDNDTLGF